MIANSYNSYSQVIASPAARPPGRPAAKFLSHARAYLHIEYCCYY